MVLIHGTFGFKKAAQARDRWSVMGRVLKDEGRCLYALEYGTNWLGTMGVKDIRDSAKQLATFVDGVKAATNASKVDLVGYSQGGLVARSYLKDRDGARSVDDLVTLGTPNRGTDTTSAWWGSWVYKAVDQMMPDSDFLKKLNKGGELMPGVSYTALATPEDGVVTPFTSAYLHGPTEQLTNATVPSIPGSDEEPHTEFCANPAAVQWVREALRSPGPANPYFKPVGTLA
ncbi:alpha/beta fold hydrolase [Streptomyces pathocidini]|uniref:Alpha/beta fold hydrolase n=1 Tax=Streptomyces pathocidini TaxID=1650571 RepID=A0ABW7UNV3_9ACTN|nr:alpha/beta fold hydrolase [Streptomyces pathocidini]